MKSLDKIKDIEKEVDYINSLLTPKTFKVSFDNTKGANNYLILVGSDEFTFYTYGDLINALLVFRTIFEKSIKERGLKK